MKAHIVGGGFGALAAAACLIRDAGCPARISPSTRRVTGWAARSRWPARRRPATSCRQAPSLIRSSAVTFDLLATIPSAAIQRSPSRTISSPSMSATHTTTEHTSSIETAASCTGRHFGLSTRDRLDLVRLTLTPEAMLDGRRIDEFFRADFFATEFWLLWTTIMGPLPQHSAMEMRRYMNRFLPLLPDLSVMSHVLRRRFDQYEAIIEPMVAWLRPRGVTFLTGSFVHDIGFAPSPGCITASRLDYERDGAATSVAVAPEDVVLVTLGSQAADLSVGNR